ncbi:MAG: hypothetical protein GX158_07020 [Bacteroidales bacterium]|nr:hypothetical protein [Bacteroidales bacterium]
MKKLIFTPILALLIAAGSTAPAQDFPDEYLGLPGDNLNLYAVMKLFQESETLEGFERNLNDENSRINNLDLNGDNLIDYITVHDYVDGDVHTIVLRAALSRNEFQDVAVFTVQKFSNGSVHIQLVGDEALYGKNYIIEPIYNETPNPGYTGRAVASQRVNVTVVRTTPYEVAVWPVISYIYSPRYVVWRSAWYWGYYPSYWRPWRPYYWHYYYGYHYNWYHHYYNHYRYWPHYRYPRYTAYYYTTVRVHSTYVTQRVRDGYYRTTYSRPEQRREGEALFARVNPDQTRRTAENTPAQRLRREVSGQGNERNAATGTARRQAEQNSERAATRSSDSRNTGTERRAAAGGTERTAPAQNSSTERRAATGGTERTAPAQNSSTERRAATGGTERTAPAQNRSTERRAATGGTEKPAATATEKAATERTAPAQNNSTERRTTPAATEKAATERTAPVQKSSTVRSTPATVSPQSVAKPAPAARSQSARSAKSAATARPQQNKTARESRQARTSDKNAGKKESRGNQASRRK